LLGAPKKKITWPQPAVGDPEYFKYLTDC